MFSWCHGAPKLSWQAFYHEKAFFWTTLTRYAFSGFGSHFFNNAVNIFMQSSNNFYISYIHFTKRAMNSFGYIARIYGTCFIIVWHLRNRYVVIFIIEDWEQVIFYFAISSDHIWLALNIEILTLEIAIGRKELCHLAFFFIRNRDIVHQRNRFPCT